MKEENEKLMKRKMPVKNRLMDIVSVFVAATFLFSNIAFADVSTDTLAPYLVTAAKINGIKEISGRTGRDLDSWAKRSISSWLVDARADVVKMEVELTPEIATVFFIKALDRGVVEFEATAPGKKEIMDMRQAAKEIRAITPGIIRALMAGSTGAIRMNGQGLTASEHGTRIKGHSEYARKRLELVRSEDTVNGAVARLISGPGAPSALALQGGKIPGDVAIPFLSAFEGDGKLKALETALQGLGINFILIKGLKEELAKTKVAQDLVFHYGATRRSVYMDEDDFKYLFSLPNGVDIIVEGAKHEAAHIDNEMANLENPENEPLLLEDQIEARATSFNVRRAIERREKGDAVDSIQKASLKDTLMSEDKAFTVSIPELVKQYDKNIAWFIDRLDKSTAGTRGKLDIGDILAGKELNAAVVAFAAQGYANYIKNNFPEEQWGEFTGFDPRYFSKEFAHIYTRIMLANGIKVYRDMDEKHTATPVTSFMAYYFKLACGIEITSSHNPPEQNGIKSSTIYGGVDTDDISAKIVKEMKGLFEAGKRGTGEIRFDAYDTGRINFVDAKKIYYENYIKRLFTKDAIDRMKTAMDSGAKFIFDGLFGVGGPSVVYYLDRVFEGYDWRGKVIVMNDTTDPNIGGIRRPDPSRPETLQYSGALQKLAETEGVLVAVTADMDSDRIGTAVIIPERDVARAKRYGLFVSNMKFAGQVVNIVRFTPNQVFTLISYERVLEAYRKKLGRPDLTINDIDEAIRAGTAPELILLTSIPSSMIAKAMIERFGGKVILTTVGFKNLGYQAQKLDQENPNAIIVALMEESGGAVIGPLGERDARGSSIHRDKDTIALAFGLFTAASRLFPEENLLDLYVEMGENLKGLFYYERLDAYLPNQTDAESSDPAIVAQADAIKRDMIAKFRFIDYVKETGQARRNLENVENAKKLCEIFGKKYEDIEKTENDVEVPNTDLLVEKPNGEWEHIAPRAIRFTFKDGEVIEAFHTGRDDQEGPSITIYGRDGKMRARTLIRPSGTESLLRVYMEIFEPQDNPRPENLYNVFTPLLNYLGLNGYSLTPGGKDYVAEYINGVNVKYDIEKRVRQEAELVAAAVVGRKLHTPLAAATPEMAARLMQGGYNQSGYGVPVGASIDGSFAIGDEGNQGYYVNGGRDIFTGTVDAMKRFFANRAHILGKPIKYVIKPGIGGQHTPFQGIASAFEVIDVGTGVVVGEYELGKNYERSLSAVLDKLGAEWGEVALIPSSKSGSTDETMMIFSEIFYVMLKNIAAKEGLDGELFADVVLNTMNEVNFINGKERPAKDLFKGFGIALTQSNMKRARLDVTPDQVKKIFGIVLGNMFFETTDRPDQSRLSAFIRNSGLDKELGENAPGFGAMFDNVGGRWTADLHMMTFLAFNGLDALSYWNARYKGISAVREGTHNANKLAGKILNEGIKDIALVVPDELFWFGKAMEQNFNESIWQKGFANLVAVKESAWEAQSSHYAGKPSALVINISELAIPVGSFNVFDLGTFKPEGMPAQHLANSLGELFTTFYGMTHNVGNALIARALAEKGFTADDVDLNDLDNPATKIVQKNLYVRQPYVELGKGLLERMLKVLQESGPKAIDAELKAIKESAKKMVLASKIDGVDLPGNVTSRESLAEVISKAMAFAKKTDRKFVPFIYLEGDKFLEMREYLISLGVEWVMQGTGDQHISYQQVLAQPQKYLPFIISFVSEEVQPGRRAIGFAKGYLDNVSPNMLRDLFAEASYAALVTPRKDEAGEPVLGAAGIFLSIEDTFSKRDMLMLSFDSVMKAAEAGGKFDHTVATIMKSSNTGERARRTAETLFKVKEVKASVKKHLIFVKSAIPAEQLATTTAVNCANYCADYYNEMEGYTADIVDTYEDAVKLLAKNSDWDKTNTIVGLIDRPALDKMTAELEKNGMQDKTKLLPMERFDKGQFVPLKGFFDLMSVLVQVNRPLDRPEDRELRDNIKDLLNEIGVRDVNDLVNALSIAAYFEDPIKFAKNFIIRLLPPTKAASLTELRDRYNAAKKVIESL